VVDYRDSDVYAVTSNGKQMISKGAYVGDSNVEWEM